MRTHPKSARIPEVLTIAPEYNQKKNYKKRNKSQKWNPWFEEKIWWANEAAKMEKGPQY